MASVKPEVVITSHLNDIYTTFQILCTFSTMPTPIGPFKTSKMTSKKPEVVIILPLIDIPMWFQILSPFSTMLDPIGPFRTSKITSEKPEVVITSPLNDISTSFQILSTFFDHAHTNRIFCDLQNDFRKTGSSYNFAINWHFYIISNPKHFFRPCPLQKDFLGLPKWLPQNRK